MLIKSLRIVCMGFVLFLTARGQIFAQEKIYPVEAGINISQANIKVDGDISDWLKAGIEPLTDPVWANIYGMPLFNDFRRFKSVQLAYNRENLFILFELNPLGQRRIYEIEKMPVFSRIHLDIDADKNTGTKRTVDDEYAGWDSRVSLSRAKGVTGYQIEKLLSCAQEELETGGFNVDIKTEAIGGGKKFSNKDSDYISANDAYIEMRLPLAMLGHKCAICAPFQIKLVIEDMVSLPPAELRLNARLKRWWCW